MKTSTEHLIKTAAKLRRRASLYHPTDTVPVKAATLDMVATMLEEAAVTEAAFDGCEKVRMAQHSTLSGVRHLAERAASVGVGVDPTDLLNLLDGEGSR